MHRRTCSTVRMRLTSSPLPFGMNRSIIELLAGILPSVVPVFRANLLGFSEHFQVAFLDPKSAVAQALDLIGVV